MWQFVQFPLPANNLSPAATSPVWARAFTKAIPAQIASSRIRFIKRVRTILARKDADIARR
jgi:hypothetical protein